MKKIDRLKKNLFLLSALSIIGLSKPTVYAKEDDTKITTNKDKECEKGTDYITYYSNVYGIKEEYIYDYLDYMLNENPNNEEFKNLSTELKVLEAVRYLYYESPYDKSIISTGKEYEVSLEPEEMVEKYADLYDINKEVALSIVYCECGSNVDSYNYLNNNNPAGLGPYMYFENKEIGIIYYINLLKNGYGCSKNSGKEFLQSIASTYCEIPDHWLSLTIPFYNNICNDYYYMKPELKNKKKVYTLKKED